MPCIEAEYNANLIVTYNAARMDNIVFFPSRVKKRKKQTSYAALGFHNTKQF